MPGVPAIPVRVGNQRVLAAKAARDGPRYRAAVLARTFVPGDRVVVQDKLGGPYLRQAVVTRASGRNIFFVEQQGGPELRRNRRFVRKAPRGGGDGDDDNGDYDGDGDGDNGGRPPSQPPPLPPQAGTARRQAGDGGADSQQHPPQVAAQRVPPPVPPRNRSRRTTAGRLPARFAD